MSESVSPIPAGYHTVTPYLMVKHAGGLIDFLHRAFAAVELEVIDEGVGIEERLRNTNITWLGHVMSSKQTVTVGQPNSLVNRPSGTESDASIW